MAASFHLKRNTLTIMWFFLSLSLSSQVVFSDNFSNPNANWQGINLSGGGTFNVSNGIMNLTANNNATFGVYNNQLLSGHFYIEVDFGADDNVALALFNARANGSADPNNYSLIKVEEVNGVPVVSISDKQNGNNDVLDNTGALSNYEKNIRYKNTLDASTFSIPYTSTNKKLRIFRHENEKFIHFSYHVKKNVDGQDATGWIELAPSREWNQLSGNFLMGLIAIDGSATFDNALAISKPIQDQNDLNTGFQATQREMNWSGYFGDALVITFDANDAPLTGGTRKFVFWEALNNVPAWYLDEEVMYTYEFVETWDGGSPGPHEPMSDRLRRFSNVTLEYDGPDYKLIHWEYVLMDPDYRWPDFGLGTEIPLVDEYYKIYPDGTILRKIRYKAKLDTQFRNWHELTELIVISGNVTDPSEHLESPALSIWPINGNRSDYDPTGRGNDYEQSNNDATIMAVHMINHPDLVNAFNDNSNFPDTYAGDPITFYKTWHDKFFHMSHWPINKEQYYSDPFKSVTTWKEQIKHTSLAGAGAYENNSSQWTTNFQVDPVDGREFREWISYMGLSPKGNLDQAKANVQAWLPSPWDWSGIPEPSVNLALNQPTTTSSVGSNNTGNKAVDGNENTRWESQHGSDPEWIYVDLGESYDINNVVINWEAAYSSAYRIEVSDNATNWNTVFTENASNGGLDDIILSNATGRYLRVFGTARATQYGHSIYELEVYGTSATNVPTNIALNKPTAQSSTGSGGLSSRAVDGNTDGNYGAQSTTHTSSEQNAWWRVDLGAFYAISQISIFNRTDCCMNRLNGAEVYVGNSPSDLPTDYNFVGSLGANASYDFTTNITGRYLFIRKNNSGFLSLAEVQVFGTFVSDVLTNVALNKSTVQSSTGYGGVSSRAVDGNTNGDYGAGSITHTNFEQNAWWRVDLGASYNISQISIFNRTNCCMDRLNGVEVYVGNSPSNSPANYTFISSLGANASYDLATNVTGRYVFVRKSNSGYLSLAEVQVFGTEVISARVNNNQNNSSALSFDPAINIYPNPLSGEFLNLAFESQFNSSYEIQIINMNGGKVVFRTEFEASSGRNKIPLNVLSLPSGIYALRLMNTSEGNHENFLRKFVITH